MSLMNPQLKRDLGRYAENKLCTYMKDVIQSFQIAEQPPSVALACIAALLMKVGATIAYETNISHERFVALCALAYDHASKEKGE